MSNKLVFVIILIIGLSKITYAENYKYDVTKVNYKNLVANLYVPKINVKVPVVIAIGGSEGGISTGDSNGEMIAPHGIAVLHHSRQDDVPVRLQLVRRVI